MADQELSTIIPMLQDVALSRYLAVVGFTLCIYDWMLVWDEEYELVGKSRLSLGKVLYYYARLATVPGLIFALYHLSPFRGPLDKTVCVVFFFIDPTLQAATLMGSYWLLMLRVVALYKSRPVLVWILYGGLFGAYACAFGTLLRAQVFLIASLEYSDTLGICASPDRAPTLSFVFWGPLFFDLLLCSFTINHARKGWKSRPDYAVVPLLKVMYRDGTMFCLVMFSIRIWNISIWRSQPLSRTFLGLYILWSLVTVLCSRIYLNVIQAARSNDMDRTLPHSSVTSKVQSRSIPATSPSNYSPLVEFPPNRFRRNDYRGESFLPDQFTPSNSHQGRLSRVVGKPLPVVQAPALRTIDSNHYESSYFPS